MALLDTSKPNAVACSFLARTAPQPLSLATNLISPQLNVRPDGGGRLLLQALELDDLADPARHLRSMAILPSSSAIATTRCLQMQANCRLRTL
ncbi:hypothetical protein LZ023_35400 (plasmid) [Pseudomonas silvicola]|nr:hypothetical protein LZ023_35400 [Pseudomonas silvicola]